MQNKFILVLDHDGIIHPNELLEEYLKKIDYRASSEYHDYLIQAMDERELTKEKFDTLMMEHYFIKDQILEEVEERYKGQIPYDLIYTIKNAYKDIVEKIKFIHYTGAFDEILLNSHSNVDFERTRKDIFYETYLPFVKRYYPPFHQDKFNSDLENVYENNNRQRTHKGLYLMQQLGVTNLKNYYAIDDSLSICKEYQFCGAKSFYKRQDESSVDVLLRAARAAFDDRRDLEKSKGKTYRKI